MYGNPGCVPVCMFDGLQLSPGRPADLERATSLNRSVRQKRKKSVGDYYLIWLFWALVVVHLWIYKFFLLILPVPIVFVVVKKLGMTS